MTFFEMEIGVLASKVAEPVLVLVFIFDPGVTIAGFWHPIWVFFQDVADV